MFITADLQVMSVNLTLRLSERPIWPCSGSNEEHNSGVRFCCGFRPFQSRKLKNKFDEFGGESGSTAVGSFTHPHLP